MSKKHGVTPTSGKLRKVPLQPAGPRVLILTENGTNILEEDPAWDLIAYNKIGGTKKKLCFMILSKGQCSHKKKIFSSDKAC